jgi:hypothetical protein
MILPRVNNGEPIRKFNWRKDDFYQFWFSVQNSDDPAFCDTLEYALKKDVGCQDDLYQSPPYLGDAPNIIFTLD